MSGLREEASGEDLRVARCDDGRCGRECGGAFMRNPESRISRLEKLLGARPCNGCDALNLYRVVYGRWAVADESVTCPECGRVHRIHAVRVVTVGSSKADEAEWARMIAGGH